MTLKVWGGWTFVNGKQVRTIVATLTKKKACELLDIPYYYFKDYWCATGNEKELEVALEFPNTVFVNMGSNIPGKEDFQRMKER